MKVLLLTQPSGLRQVLSLEAKPFWANQNLKLQAEFPNLIVDLQEMEEKEAIELVEAEPIAPNHKVGLTNVVAEISKVHEKELSAKDKEIEELKAALAKKSEKAK
jgi:hypothetical protein